MTASQIEIQLIAVIVAAACALPGVFLILRRMVMMSDAISHAILLGIVLAFFVTGDLSSPFLVLAAAATGVLTVVLTEMVKRTGLVREDASIGLVFPALFSIGIILISRFASDVHLDADAVLLGELAFAPFNRFELFGVDLGPKALAVMSGVLAINLLFIIIFYKELKLATFDSGLAAAIGFSPAIINYSLMSLVSVTAVGAFDAVGSILVVALMVASPATAYLLTDRLWLMLVISVITGAVSAVCGYWLAHFLDASIAGSMATMAGFLFGVVFLIAPQRGLLAMARRKFRQRWDFAQIMLAIHISNHEGKPEEREECRLDTLHTHMQWDEQFTAKVVRLAHKNDLIAIDTGQVRLTAAGRQSAAETMTL